MNAAQRRTSYIKMIVANSSIPVADLRKLGTVDLAEIAATDTTDCIDADCVSAYLFATWETITGQI